MSVIIEQLISSALLVITVFFSFYVLSAIVVNKDDE